MPSNLPGHLSGHLPGILVQGLGEGLRAWMSTRLGGVSAAPFDSLNIGRSSGDDPAAVAENRARVERQMGAPLVWLHQVHGTRCVRVESGEGLETADAAVTRQPNLTLAIQVADCLPVLLAALDPQGRALAVGGAHAGWRGLAAGVLENCVEQLREMAPGAELRAWLGPCIGPQAFEVGAEVHEAFADDAALLRFAARADGDPRWLADLQGLALARLERLGIHTILRESACTFSDASRFHSFRRDGSRSGRLVACIRLGDGLLA